MARVKANPDFMGYSIKRLSGKREKIVEVLVGGYKTDAGGAMVKAAFVTQGRGKILQEHKTRQEEYAGKDKTTRAVAKAPAKQSKAPAKKAPAKKAPAKKAATKPTKKTRAVVKEHSKPAPKVKGSAVKAAVETAIERAKVNPIEPVTTVYKFLTREAKDIRNIIMQAVNDAVDTSAYTIAVRNGIQGAEVQINNEVGTGGPEMRIMFDIIPTEPEPSDEPEIYVEQGFADMAALTLLSDKTLSTYEAGMEVARTATPKAKRVLSQYDVGGGVLMKNSEFALVGFDIESNQFIVAVITHKGKSLGSIMRMSPSRFLSSCSPFDLDSDDQTSDHRADDFDTDDVADYDDDADFEEIPEETEPDFDDLDDEPDFDDEDDLGEEPDFDDEPDDEEDDLDEDFEDTEDEDFDDEDDEDNDFDEDFDDIDDLE